jgi:heme/copper-type cytochrome/quinol oxidase subunit 2
MNQPLAETIFWIAALACVVAEAAILRSSFAAPHHENPTLVPTASRTGELLWAVLPAVALAVLLFFTWQRVDARSAHAGVMDHSHMAMPMPAGTQ